MVTYTSAEHGICIVPCRKTKELTGALSSCPLHFPTGELYTLHFSKEMIKLLTSGPREAAYPEELYIPCYFQLRCTVLGKHNTTASALWSGADKSQKELEALAEHSPLWTALCKFIHFILKADYTFTKHLQCNRLKLPKIKSCILNLLKTV